MKKEKIRLDELLVKKKLVPNLDRATSLIMIGSILVDEQKILQVGKKVLIDAHIRILNKIPDYVSRGALKLKSALEHFQISVKDKICLDLGASTGGFTEILLRREAKRVYAFDVGYGQMASRLQNDPRVKLKDRYNVKNLSWNEIVEENYSEVLIVMDLSFISILPIFEKIFVMKTENPSIKIQVLSLIKPQFESKENETVKGIVLDPKVHFRVLKRILLFVKKNIKAEVHGICNSPIKGQSGNKEFFVNFTL
jgi:23S rRNA (cytidine1920-2'-O)/16S rRNA (cytidine1409-2'-O)-methyltransferase